MYRSFCSKRISRNLLEMAFNSFSSFFSNIIFLRCAVFGDRPCVVEATVAVVAVVAVFFAFRSRRFMMMYLYKKNIHIPPYSTSPPMEGILMIPCALSVVTSSLIDIGISRLACPQGKHLNFMNGGTCESMQGIPIPPLPVIGLVVFTVSIVLALGGGMVLGGTMLAMVAPVAVSILWSSIGSSFYAAYKPDYFRGDITDHITPPSTTIKNFQ